MGQIHFSFIWNLEFTSNHVGDKRVCGTETSITMLILFPFPRAVGANANRAGSMDTQTMLGFRSHDSKFQMRACPFDPFSRGSLHGNGNRDQCKIASLSPTPPRLAHHKFKSYIAFKVSQSQNVSCAAQSDHLNIVVPSTRIISYNPLKTIWYCYATQSLRTLTKRILLDRSEWIISNRLKRLTFVISESVAWRRVAQRRSLISFCCYIAECGLSGSNGQTHNLKIWTVASDLPWTPNCVRLPFEPAIFAFSKTAHGEEFGESAFRC